MIVNNKNMYNKIIIFAAPQRIVPGNMLNT